MSDNVSKSSAHDKQLQFLFNNLGNEYGIRPDSLVILKDFAESDCYLTDYAGCEYYEKLEDILREMLWVIQGFNQANGY